MGVLARALLKAPGQRLKLLPAGEAWLERGARWPRPADALTLYRIGGIEFTPVPVWLDEKGATAAVIDDWFEVLGDPLKPSLPPAAGRAGRGRPGLERRRRAPPHAPARRAR